MLFYKRIPLFRLAFPFAAGVAGGIYLGDWVIGSTAVSFSIIAAFIILFVVALLTRKDFYKLRFLHGFSIHSLALFCGIAVSIFQTERFYPNHISGMDEKPHQFLVQARANVIEKTKTYKLEAEVLNLLENGKSKAANGSVIFYLDKDSASAAIRYGDVLLINAPLQKLRKAQNPAQFDYRQFLLFRQATRQAHISSGNFLFTGTNNGNPVMKWIGELREKMLNILRTHGLEGREFAVGAALILGYTDELDPEIMRAYAGSGALHVLSVSGLHVGIMYLVMSFFLSFLDKRKRGNIIKAVALLIFLAFYAMITGLSPSVLRASVMFGFIVIAKSFNQHTNIYNTLAISAISLLVYDPYLVMQVGFQLSYLAVIGIVAIQPLLVALWEPKTKLMKWVWEITCVSIAAQIATAPLGFLYFHQFPVYFMFSNLIVIPLSTGILYVGLATLVLSIIPVLCNYFAFVLKWMIWLLNKSVEITEALPYSILGGIDISITETWLLYTLVLALFIFFTKKNMPAFFVGLIVLFVISVTQLLETIEQYSQQQFIVYNVPETSAFDVVKGTENLFYAPTDLVNNKDKMLFNIEHNWWKHGLNKQTNIYLDSLKNNSGIIYLPATNKKVIRINNSFDTKPVYSKKLKTDIVILSEDTELKIQQVLDYFNPELIIFDSSNSGKARRKWKKQCEKAAIKFYDVAEQGAFVTEL